MCPTMIGHSQININYKNTIEEDNTQIQCFRKVAVHLGYGTVQYIDLVVSIEVAVEVCCCSTVFRC
jgi:hypothetical protein